MAEDKPKLIFAVTEDRYFYSHRRPMIAAAQDCGFDVCAVTNEGAYKEKIEALGVRLIPFSFARRSLNPLKALRQVQELARIYRDEKPAVIHHIAMKPVLLGSIAAWIAKAPRVINAFAGLGYVFNSFSPLALFLRAALMPAFFVLLRRPGSWLLFQNEDDMKTLARTGLVVKGRAQVIRGSGVDLKEFPAQAMSPPAPDFICVYAGRMIDIKGLKTLKEAFLRFENMAPHIKLRLYGSPDNANPGSWSEEKLRDWARTHRNVSYEGNADDMPEVWGQAHVAVQPSYGGEGVPKSLLEAAASGRPIVATDVPGCREVAVHGENGLLVPPRKAQALADAINELAENWHMCVEMGKRSSAIAAEMAADRVRIQTGAFYRAVLDNKQD